MSLNCIVKFSCFKTFSFQRILALTLTQHTLLSPSHALLAATIVFAVHSLLVGSHQGQVVTPTCPVHHSGLPPPSHDSCYNLQQQKLNSDIPYFMWSHLHILHKSTFFVSRRMSKKDLPLNKIPVPQVIIILGGACLL